MSAPTNPLLFPDHALWRHHSLYSADVASRLSSVYRLLRSAAGDTRAHETALSRMLPCLTQQMMPYQQLNVFYMLGMCCSGLSAYTEAIDWLTEALELALDIEELEALVDLLILRGANFRAISYDAEAAEDYTFGLELLEAPTPGKQQRNRPLQLHLITARAGVEFMLAHYTTAEALIAQGQALALDLPNVAVDLAALRWIEALLYRWRGEPQLALVKALQAVEIIKEKGTACSLSRLSSVVADAALDAEESLPKDAHHRLRTELFTVAHTFAEQAIRVGHEAADFNGEALGTITQARLNRARQDNRDTQSVIESAIRTARHLGDLCLLAEAQTALGKDLAAQGQMESALSCYRNVLAITEISDLPAIGVWARRALLRASEMRVD